MASYPDFAAVQTETSSDIRYNSSSYPLADKTDLDIPADDDDIIALLQKCNNEVCLSAGMP